MKLARGDSRVFVVLMERGVVCDELKQSQVFALFTRNLARRRLRMEQR